VEIVYLHTLDMLVLIWIVEFCLHRISNIVSLRLIEID